MSCNLCLEPAPAGLCPALLVAVCWPEPNSASVLLNFSSAKIRPSESLVRIAASPARWIGLDQLKRTCPKDRLQLLFLRVQLLVSLGAQFAQPLAQFTKPLPLARLAPRFFARKFLLRARARSSAKPGTGSTPPLHALTSLSLSLSLSLSPSLVTPQLLWQELRHANVLAQRCQPELSSASSSIHTYPWTNSPRGRIARKHTLLIL